MWWVNTRATPDNQLMRYNTSRCAYHDVVFKLPLYLTPTIRAQCNNHLISHMILNFSHKFNSLILNSEQFLNFLPWTKATRQLDISLISVFGTIIFFNLFDYLIVCNSVIIHSINNQNFPLCHRNSKKDMRLLPGRV